MQPSNNSRQNPTGRPSIDGMVARGAPMRRPVVNDFAVRRPAYSAPAPQPTPRPAASISSVLQPAVPSAPPLPPHPKPATPPSTAPAPAQPTASVFRAVPTTSPTSAPTLQPSRAQTPGASPSTPLAPPPQATPAPPAQPATHRTAPTQDRPHAKPFAQPKHERSHAGLVGFIVFVALSVVAFAPFVSGVILQNAPGSSQSVTSGTDTIGCATTLASPTTTAAYTSKVGFPIVYSYTQTTTYSATCESKRSSVISSRESQFNPLGVLINLAAVITLATATAKLWKLIRER